MNKSKKGVRNYRITKRLISRFIVYEDEQIKN